MHIFILILSVITHGGVWSGLTPLGPPHLIVWYVIVFCPLPPRQLSWGNFGLFTKRVLSLPPGVGNLALSSAFCQRRPRSGRGEPQDTAAERCEQFISRNYPGLRPLPTWRPQQILIFLENPSDLETQEMNPVPRVAAESLGFEPRLRAVQILLRLQNFSLQRKENRPCVCWQRLGLAPGTPCVHN